MIRDKSEINFPISFWFINRSFHTKLYNKIFKCHTTQSENLIGFDFRDIIIRKINLIGLDRIDKLSCLFSNKEKNIMYQMFGIEDMYRQESTKSLQAYAKIYNQENDDIDNAIRTLSKMKSK